MRYLSVAECKRLVNATDAQFRPMVLAALQTGARYSELCRLEASDLNADAGTIAIRQSKSGKSRDVILTEEGVALFKQLAAGKTAHRLLLTRASGLPYTTSNQQEPMIDASARAKIKPRVSFHIVRHTYASLSVMNGMQLMVVAKNLGHSDTRMVEKHYGHLSPSFVAEAVRKSAPRFGISLATGCLAASLAWGKRDDGDLPPLCKKAGGETELLKRLEAAQKNKPRHGGRRKGAVSYPLDAEHASFLRWWCGEMERLYGIPPSKTIRHFASGPERGRKALAKHGVRAKLITDVLGASTNAIARRLKRKMRKP